jgi:polar amino acid transport system substrate-binding protein
MMRSLGQVGMLLTLLCSLASTGLALADIPRIGAEDDWYPYTAWRDERIVGMSADIVRAAFATSNTPIELAAYPYSRCMELARVGGLAACFNTTPDARIKALFLLPEEVLFSDDILLWARHGAAALENLDSLAGKRVAVTIGYTYGEHFDAREDIQRVPVRRDLNGFLMLQRDRVDYMVAFRGTTQALIEQHPELAEQFVALATVHQPQLYLTFSRHHPQAPALLQLFDQGMRQIRSDGTYQKILQRWQLPARQAAAHTTTLLNNHDNQTESP